MFRKVLARVVLNVKTTKLIALLISARFDQSPTGVLFRMIRFPPSLRSFSPGCNKHLEYQT